MADTWQRKLILVAACLVLLSPVSGLVGAGSSQPSPDRATGVNGPYSLQEGFAPTCPENSFVIDPCEDQIAALLDAFTRTPQANRVIEPSDTVVVDFSGDTMGGYTHIAVTNVGQPGHRDITYYTGQDRPPQDADVTIKTTPDAVRTIINSEDPLDAMIRAMYEEWVVATFGNPFSQAAWNAVVLEALSGFYPQGFLNPEDFEGEDSDVTLPNGQKGTAELLKKGPAPVYVVRTEGPDAVLNEHGSQIGWLPEGHDIFANPPRETGITLDPSAGTILATRTVLPPPPPPLPAVNDSDDGEASASAPDPSEQALVEIMARLLGGEYRGIRVAEEELRESGPEVTTPDPSEFTPVIPELPENPEEYKTPQKEKPWTEAILKREKPSYTKGMSYLRESNGGSYAAGMYTSTYAREAARSNPAYGRTAAVAVGGGYFAAGAAG